MLRALKISTNMSLLVWFDDPFYAGERSVESNQHGRALRDVNCPQVFFKIESSYQKVRYHEKKELRLNKMKGNNQLLRKTLLKTDENGVREKRI